MVERDEITLDSSYLDVESMTLQGDNTVADMMAKAIMWNYGFSAPDMVLRTHSNCENSSSPTSQGMADAAKMLDASFSWSRIGGTSYLKHGNIVALYNVTSRRFVRLTGDGKVNCYGNQISADALPREWASERFLVIQKGDKAAFYSLAHNTYVRVFKGRLDGNGGDVLADPPRFCELLKAQPVNGQGFQLETLAGQQVSVVCNNGSIQLNNPNASGQTDPCTRFQAVLISDTFSDNSLE